MNLCFIVKLESFSVILWSGLMTAISFGSLSGPVLLALLDRDVVNVLYASPSGWYFVLIFIDQVFGGLGELELLKLTLFQSVYSFVS